MRAVDLVLIRFSSIDDAAALTHLHRQVPTLRLYGALQGNEVYAYAEVGMQDRLDRVLPAAVVVSTLRCTLAITGAAAGTEAPFHYVVETDVLPEQDADFNAWYDSEHLPGLAAVPGTVSAARYVRGGGSPRYHACYDLASLETFGSPAWLAVRGTEWSSRVRPHFRNTKRTMFRRL